MRIGSKGRYALKAMIALAREKDVAKPVTIKDLAERETIPADFLEQILHRLKRAGIVTSTRGPGGGFRIARPKAEIKLIEILEAAGETIGSIEAKSPGKAKTCEATRELRALDDILRGYASKRTLAQMISDLS